MTIATHTGAVEARPCSRCGAVVEHRESITLSCGPETRWWSAEAHAAPCGQPCFGGSTVGVKRDQIIAYHGYQDRCPKCGPLRVLPEVVVEMRGRAYGLEGLLVAARPLEDTNHSQSCGCADCQRVWGHAGNLSDNREIAVEASEIVRRDHLLALDEIDKLRAELAQTREALDEAREQATWARQELMDREVAEEEKRTQAQQAEHRSPPVEWAWLDEKHRAEVCRWVREQIEEIRWLPKVLREAGRPELALEREAFAASLMALIALPEVPSPLTDEQREMLGKHVDAVFHEMMSARWREASMAIGERLFLRGLGAGRDLLEAGQLLRRLLVCEDIPRADREIPPGLQIAVGRVVGAVERLGDIPPDREATRIPEPATEQERAPLAAPIERGPVSELVEVASFEECRPVFGAGPR